MSRHLCSVNLYMSHLQATSVRHSALALSETSPIKISHDSISRWLNQVKLSSKRLWKAAKPLISGRGILIVDDSVLNKSRSEKIELASPQYSGSTHGIVNGINIVTLLWHNPETGVSTPIDFRICDYNKKKEKGWKSKNKLCLEMVELALKRGVKASAIVMDSWYSSMDNLKSLRKKGVRWVVPLKKNRLVNRKVPLSNLDIPEEGRIVHLRGYGKVKVIRLVSTERRTDYVATNALDDTVEEITHLFKLRWAIEVYHRELKQTCGVERCQSRSRRAQRNHIFLAVLTWIRKFKEKKQSGCSLYRQKWKTIQSAIKHQIAVLMETYGTKLPIYENSC